MNKVSKIIWSLFSGAMCLVYKNDASAHNFNQSSASICNIYTGTYTCGDPGNPSNPAYANSKDVTNSHCSVTTVECWYTVAGNGHTLKSCTGCKTPYTLVSDGNFGDTSCNSQTSFRLTMNTCKCICSSCTDTGTWTAKGTGYEQRTGKGCDCSGSTAVCKNTTHYRCAKGWYGTTTNGTSGCTQCPSSGTTKDGGADSISDCYLPGDTTYSNTYGKYAYKCDCPYDGKNSCSSGSSSSSSAA